ncbi:MAG: hypothetical protein ACRDPA_24020 [Solirubrobacteraceae bacterium]
MWVDEDMALEGLGTGVAPARTRRRRGARVAAAPAWVRDRLATTPGRLVLVSILVVVGAVLFGAIATSAEQSRERAAKSARAQTEPLLVQAKNLYTSLSDANATVATGLLTGGGETALNRSRYLADLRTATSALSRLTSESGTSAASPVALSTIADQLPLYSGLVETARTNNRQGFPIGAAYLRQAVALSTGSMLPAADRIYRAEAQRLNDDYHTGAATSTLVTFAVASAVALILLLLAQWYVARVSRRILNVPMLAATVGVAAIAVWAIIALINEQNSLSTAQKHGSDSVEVLSASTVLLSRAQGDLSLALVNRGTDETDQLDLSAVERALTPLTGEISVLARRTGTTPAADRFDVDYASYQAQTNRIKDLQNNGELPAALALEPATSAISDRLSSDLSGQVQAAQDRFSTAATDATSALDGLAFAIPVITVLAAVAALLGLRERINEYR